MAEQKVRQILARYSKIEGEVDSGIRVHSRGEMTVFLLVGELSPIEDELLAEFESLRSLEIESKPWALLFPEEEYPAVLELLHKAFPAASIEERSEDHTVQGHLLAVLEGVFGRRFVGINFDWFILEDAQREHETDVSNGETVLKVKLVRGMVVLMILVCSFLLYRFFPKPPPDFDVLIEPRTGMRFVRVEGDCGAKVSDDELPCQSDFFMGALEVSEAEFGRLDGKSLRSLLPKVDIDYPDVRRFAGELSQGSDLCTFRLPTFEEWSYAVDLDSWRNLDDPCRYENVRGYTTDDDEIGCPGSTLQPGGSKIANGHGVYDLLGNVSEWAEVESDENPIIMGWSFRDFLEGSFARRDPRPDGLGDRSTGFRLVCEMKGLRDGGNNE